MSKRGAFSHGQTGGTAFHSVARGRRRAWTGRDHRRATGQGLLPPESAPPDPSPRASFFGSSDWRSAAIAGVLVFLVYCHTMAPDVTLEDSGELAVAADYAGVPHPPGYPVWTLYSWLFTVLVPFSNIAWRVTLGSAFAGACSCALLALMVSRGTRAMLQGMGEDFGSLDPRDRTRISTFSGWSREC